MGCTRWAANDGRQTYDGYGLNEACTGRSRFGSRLPSGLSGVLPGGRRTTATAVWLERGVHEPFPLRIGAFAGDSNKEALPVDMANRTVLAMKAASGTGGVRVMHVVPHTLAAVVYSGKDEKTA